MIRRRSRTLALFLLLALFAPVSPLWALGTAPGTVISYSAEMTYTVSGQAGVLATEASCIVSERLDVAATWQDAKAVVATPGEVDVVTTFKVTNLGNGNEPFALSVDVNLAGDDFDLALAAIWLDSDGDGRFDANRDQRYISGSNEPVLAADASILVFVLCNMPNTGALVDGQQGLVRLTATSTTSGAGTPGSVIATAGDGGVDAVIGNSGASSAASGIYEVAGTTVKILKSVLIVSDPGGNQPPLPLTGSVLRYTLLVTGQGAGSAQSVVVADRIPVNTQYRGGSLTLDNVVLSDAADGDAGAVSAEAVEVVLGTLKSPEKRTITFEVTID